MPTAPGLDGHTFHSPANGRRFEHWTWAHPDVPVTAPQPLVLLLHGVDDSPSCWWAKGGAVETAAALVESGEVEPFVLLMAGDTGRARGSAYCDWADGTCRAETYLVDELLGWATRNLPVAGAPVSVTGLSMGGYGAVTLALRHPGLFAAATSLSGFFDPRRTFSFIESAEEAMWGPAGPAGHDPRLLVQDSRRRAGLRLMFDCGTEDHLIDDNRAFHERLDALGVDHAYAEHGGGHEWAYWARHLPEHLRFVLAAG